MCVHVCVLLYINYYAAVNAINVPVIVNPVRTSSAATFEISLSPNTNNLDIVYEVSYYPNEGLQFDEVRTYNKSCLDNTYL